MNACPWNQRDLKDSNWKYYKGNIKTLPRWNSQCYVTYISDISLKKYINDISSSLYMAGNILSKNLTCHLFMMKDKVTREFTAIFNLGSSALAVTNNNNILMWKFPCVQNSTCLNLIVIDSQSIAYFEAIKTDFLHRRPC